MGQAYEIAGIITSELDNGGLGVRQEAILHKVIEALIRAGLPLTVLPTALETPELLDALAEKHSPPEFFRAAEGTLNGFTFLDPTGNLLAWSDQLDNAVWQKDPLLTLTGGVADPQGGTLGWRLSNGGGAGQGLGQTLAAPGQRLRMKPSISRNVSAGTLGSKGSKGSFPRILGLNGPCPNASLAGNN